MDLDFNQNEEPKPVEGNTSVTPNNPAPASPTVNAPVESTAPNPAPATAPITSPTPSTNTAPTNVPEPSLAMPSTDQPVGQLTDLDKPNINSSVNPTPPSPPAPPKPADVLVDEPKHQVIETQVQEPVKSSKVLPIIVAILIILILAAAGAWYYSTKYINQKNPTTVGVDPSTGQTVDLDANGNPVTSTTDTSSKDTTTTQTTSTAPDLTTATGRDTQRKADLATIKSYLDAYKTQNGSYPISTEVEHVNSATSNIATALVPTYATTLPADPSSSTYFYGYKSTDGTNFQLTAVLEDQTDPAGQKIGNTFLYVVDNSGANTSGSAAINNDFTTTGN